MKTDRQFAEQLAVTLSGTTFIGIDDAREKTAHLIERAFAHVRQETLRQVAQKLSEMSAKAKTENAMAEYYAFNKAWLAVTDMDGAK